MKRKIDFKFLIILIITLVKYLKMQNYLSNNITNAIIVCAVFIIIIELLRRKRITNMKKGSILILGFLSILQMVLLRDIDIFFITLLIIVFSNEKKATTKIIKYFMISLIIIFSITVFLYFTGHLDSAYLSRILEDGTRIQRNSLGFAHPNETFIYYFFIILSVYYLTTKHKFLFYIFTIISSIILYNLTLCRTGMICVIIFLLLTLIEKKDRKYISYLFLIGTIGSFVIAYFGSDINNWINQTLSYRPFIANYHLINGNFINILGNNLTNSNNMYSIMDNAYLYLILTSGYIIYFVYLYIYQKSGKLISKDKKLSTIFTIILLYGCFESHILNIGLNFLLVIQVYLITTVKNDFTEGEDDEKN